MSTPITNSPPFLECNSHGSSTSPASPASPITPTAELTNQIATPILHNSPSSQQPLSPLPAPPIAHPSNQLANPSFQNAPVLTIGAAPQHYADRQNTFHWNGKLYKISQKVSVQLTDQEWEARVAACQKMLSSLEETTSEQTQKIKAAPEFQLYLTQDQGAVAVLKSTSENTSFTYTIPNTKRITSEILLAETDLGAKEHLIQTYKLSREKFLSGSTSIGNVGFKSGGNICYLNTAVQVLFSDKAVRDAFRNAIAQRRESSGPYQAFTEDIELGKQLDKELEQLLNKYEKAIQGSKHTVINLNPLREILVKVFKDMSSGTSGQEDPDAAYLSLLRTLEGTNQGFSVQSNTRTYGDSENNTKLYGVLCLSDAIRPVHLDLKIPTDNLNQSLTIQKCLNQHLDDSSIVSDKQTKKVNADPNYNDQGEGLQFTPKGTFTTYQTPPHELFLHLNRSDYISNNQGLSYHRKNNTSISLSSKIEIPKDHLVNDKTQNSYVLTSFSRHIGTPEGGHCIAYTREITGINNESGEFVSVYRCHDDENCRVISENDFYNASRLGGISKYKREDLVKKELTSSEDRIQDDLSLNPNLLNNNPSQPVSIDPTWRLQTNANPNQSDISDLGINSHKESPRSSRQSSSAHLSEIDEEENNAQNQRFTPISEPPPIPTSKSPNDVKKPGFTDGQSDNSLFTESPNSAGLLNATQLFQNLSAPQNNPQPLNAAPAPAPAAAVTNSSPQPSKPSTQASSVTEPPSISPREIINIELEISHKKELSRPPFESRQRLKKPDKTPYKHEYNRDQCENSISTILNNLKKELRTEHSDHNSTYKLAKINPYNHATEIDKNYMKQAITKYIDAQNKNEQFFFKQDPSNPFLLKIELNPNFNLRNLDDDYSDED